MSLFGTSPDDTPASASRSRLTLFDDGPSPAGGSKSSLFADDDDASGGSPWDMPTPKKAGRTDLLKSLLPASDVPDSYVDLYDTVLRDEDTIGGKISMAGISKVLSAGKLSADDQSRIMSIIAPGGRVASLGRNEFNVLLALIGLAQEGDDITLDGVDERRRKLPIPKLPSLVSIPSSSFSPVSTPPSQSSVPPISSPRPIQSSPPPPRTSDYHDADPWGSPKATKASFPKTNGTPKSNGDQVMERTTSNFTTTSEAENTSSTKTPTSPSSAPSSNVWDTFGGQPTSPFANPQMPPIGGDAFNSANGGGDGQGDASISRRALGGGRVTGSGPEETIVVTLLPEKEGMLFFQHHNYQVVSARRGSKVIRRYSDFVWLLDCLHKRYPFRQLPLLPPKRVAVNGNHLAADNTFIEKRRRGLIRFANALVRHPVLSQEQLVIMFLTVPTELAVWRKQASISVQDEFVGKSCPPGLEDSLAPTLNEMFETTRTGVRRSADVYINLCNYVDRLTKRNEGLAADHLRIALSLQTLADTTQDTYTQDTNDVPLINEGIHATAKHISNAQSLLEDECRAWDLGVLEDLKRQRDTLVSMRDMFDRRERYDKDNIPYLERRIQRNENKLTELRNKDQSLVKPGEAERLTEAIIKDKESIVAQHARSVLVKECVRDEINYFQQSQYHVSRWNQDWAQERVKYSEMHADNWKQLNEELESMPLGD